MGEFPSSWMVETHAADFTHPCHYQVVHPVGVPADAEPTLLVALHGMGMSGAGFLRVLRHLPEKPRLAILAPDGPYPFERREPVSGGIGSIRIGHAWYIYRGEQAEFREHLERSEAYLLELLERVRSRHGLAQKPVIWLGFSQGGYLAGFTALRHPELTRGLIMASSRLKHEFLGEALVAGELPPTLFIHGRDDQALPAARAEEGAHILEEHGARVSIDLHDAGHRLPPAAVQRIARWIAGLEGAP